MGTYWPAQTTTQMIDIGPDNGVWVRCTVIERWKNIVACTVRCGNKRSKTITRRVGLSKEDSSRFEDAVEAELGIPQIAKLKSKVAEVLTSSVKLELVAEEKDEIEFAAEECDEKEIVLYQQVRDFRFEIRKEGFFGTRTRNVELEEWTDRIYDMSRVNKNHPDCNCEKKPSVIKHYLGIKVGENIFDVEGVEEIGGREFLNKIDAEVEKAWGVGDRFCLPLHLVPKHWSLLSGEAFQKEVPCEIRFKTAGIDEFFSSEARRYIVRADTFEKLEYQAAQVETSSDSIDIKEAV